MTTCAPVPWWAKLEGDRQSTLGFVDQLRRIVRSRGPLTRRVLRDQDWGSLPGVFAVASGGIHLWHMPALVTIFGDDFHAAVRWRCPGSSVGNAAGAASQTALRWKHRSRRATRAVKSRKKAATSWPGGRSWPGTGDRDGDLEEIKFEFDTVDKWTSADP